MGYKISSLKSLPLIPWIDLYVFVLGTHQWSGGYAEIIEDNFSKIAHKLGARGAIVASHDGINLKRDLANELAAAAQKSKLIHEFVAKGESLGLSILLLGSHPQIISEKDLFLLAPIEQINNRFGSLDRFFSELCNFSENRNPDFLKRFEDRPVKRGLISEFLELKPNMFGIGVNVNAIIDHCQKR